MPNLRWVVSLDFDLKGAGGVGSLQEEKQNWTREIRVVHYMPVNMHKRIQHRERLHSVSHIPSHPSLHNTRARASRDQNKP